MASSVETSELRLLHEAIRRHHALVYRLAFRVVRNEADAEDVAQEVFLRLVRSPEALSMAESQPAWLLRATVRRSISWLRAEGRRRRRERTWAEEHLRQEKGDAEMAHDVLEKAVASLPDDLRVPLVLHYQEGMKYREIAEVCDCPQGTVARRISLAKTRLRERLAQGGAVAIAALLEETLRAGEPVLPPVGLEARLHSRVEIEIANGGSPGGGGGGGTRLAPAAWSAGSGAILLLLKAAVLALLLGGAAWIAVERTLRSDTGERLAQAAPGPRPLATSPGRVPRPSAPRQGVPASGKKDAATQRDAEPSAPGQEAPAAEEKAARPIFFGWARDAHGLPMEGVTAGILNPDRSGFRASSITDAEGYYEIEDNPHQNFAVAFGSRLAVGGSVGTAVEWVSQAQAPGAACSSGAGGGRSNCSSCHDDTVQKDTDRKETVKLWKFEKEEETRRALASYQMKLAESQFNLVQSYVRKVDLQEELAAAQGIQLQLDELASDQLLLTPRQDPMYLAAQAASFEAAIVGPFEPAGEGTEPRQVDFALLGALPVSGTVLSAGGGVIPEAEVVVAAHTGSEVLPSWAARAVADQAGCFLFEHLPRGTYVLRASAPGHVPVEEIVVAGGQGVVLRLPLAGSLRVAAAGWETDEPLGSYKVELRAGRVLIAEGTTGEDGAVRFENLPPGSYVASTYRDGSTSKYPRAKTETRVEAGAEIETRLRVPGRATVTGLVRGAGPLASTEGLIAAVVPRDGLERDPATWKSAPVGPDGAFRVEKVSPADYRLLILLASRASTEEEALAGADLSIEPGAKEVEVAVDFAPDGERATAVISEASPCAKADRLEALLPGDRSLTVQGPMRLRACLELLSRLGWAQVGSSPDLEGSNVLDHVLMDSVRAGTLLEILQPVLEANRLCLESRGGRLYLAPKPLPPLSAKAES